MHASRDARRACTGQDTGLEVAAPGLLANDTDADHDALQAEVAGAPLGGVDLRPDGSFSYEPYVNSDADDFFTYRVGDGITGTGFDGSQIPNAFQSRRLNGVIRPRSSRRSRTFRSDACVCSRAIDAGP
jgi:hypothetical protein